MKKFIKALMVSCLSVVLMLSNINVFATSALQDPKNSNQMVSPTETVGVNLYEFGERTQLFNDNWKFNLGESENAQNIIFDDSAWRSLNLPHDFSIEQDFTAAGEAESGYLLGGTGWYRKSFILDKESADKNITIDFGGAYMNTTVYVNEQRVGENVYGYTPFSFDITDYLYTDGTTENIISVKVENKTPSSRWYSGSGIYRDVKLTITDKVHVDRYGTFITSEKLEDQHGSDVDVSAKTILVNKSSQEKTISMKSGIYFNDELVNTIVSTDDIVLGANSKKEITQNLVINKPKLWGINQGNLYVIKTDVLENNVVIDSYETEYGFRYLKNDPNTGFWINGENVKLQGVCMHHDQGALGAVAYHRSIERQVEILQEMGVNAIRVTHNPAADELIKIANEKGMMIIDEAFDTWDSSKNGNSFDFARYFHTEVSTNNNNLFGAEPTMEWSEYVVKTMTNRGKNSPSIIMWSIGNEVMEGNSPNTSTYAGIAAELATWINEEDPTRAVTIGDNKFKADWKVSTDIGNELTKKGGSVGMNYSGGNHFDQYHSDNPDWSIYAAETSSSVNSRGIYSYHDNNSATTGERLLTSYDESKVGWGALASESWDMITTRDYMSGEFIWTGFDYLGEPTPWNGTGTGSVGAWPAPKTSYFGIVDTAGFEKDVFYFYQSQWNEEVQTLHMLPAWNKDVINVKSDGKVRVDVYSDAASVELFFTPKGETARQSVGKQSFTKITTPSGHTYQKVGGASKDHRALYMTFEVDYAEGTLEAVAYDSKGEIINNTKGRNIVTTTGNEEKLVATADKETILADGKDLVYITVDVTDVDGNIVPDASNNVVFNVTNGKLIGVDNGKQTDHSSYQANNRDAFSGKVLAIVQAGTAGGDITITASSDNLESSTVVVKSIKDNTQPKTILSYEIGKNYFVKLNTVPIIQDKVKLNFSDNTQTTESVVWNTYDSNLLSQVGSFTVSGRTTESNVPVSVNINMIAEYKGLLDYSVVTPIGQIPVLPKSRPLVLTNGLISPVEFPVIWEEIAMNDVEKAGILKINGTSNVLGDMVNVTASIRVADTLYTEIGNAASQYLNLTQSIPSNLENGVLESIVDDELYDVTNLNKRWTTSGTKGNEDHSIVNIDFEYATALNFGKVVLYHYVKDGESIMPSSVKFEYAIFAGEGASFIPVTATASQPIIDEKNPQIQKVEYTFDSPVNAVILRIIQENNDATKYIGLTEAQLITYEGSVESNSSAEITGIAIDGKKVPEFQLNNGIDRKSVV